MVAYIRLGTVRLHVCVACVAACVQRLYKYVTDEINRITHSTLSDMPTNPSATRRSWPVRLMPSSQSCPNIFGGSSLHDIYLTKVLMDARE